MARLGRIVLFLLACAVMLLVPSAASAKDCIAPPGTAGIDQYCETVPSAGGDRGTGPNASGSPAPVSGRTVSALDRSEDGQAFNQFLGQTGEHPHSKSKSGSAPRKEAVPLNSRSVDEPSSNPLAAVRSAVSSGDTLGDGFVWIMLAITLLVAALAWLAYRRRPTP